MLVAQEVLEAVVQVKLGCILPGGQIQVAGGSRCQPLLTPQPRTHERLQHAPAGSLPAPTRSGVQLQMPSSPPRPFDSNVTVSFFFPHLERSQ